MPRGTWARAVSSGTGEQACISHLLGVLPQPVGVLIRQAPPLDCTWLLHRLLSHWEPETVNTAAPDNPSSLLRNTSTSILLKIISQLLQAN